MKYHGAILVSLLVHTALLWCLFDTTLIKHTPETPKSLSTYIIPLAQQRRILAELEKSKPTEEVPERESPQLIKADAVPVEVVSLTSENKAQPQIEVHSERDTASAKDVPPSSAKVIKLPFKRINPYGGVKRVLDKEMSAFSDGQTQTVQQQRFAKPVTIPKKHMAYNQVEEIASSGDRSIFKWRGKCYIMNRSSAMASVDMPSSGPGRCPGEKTDDEILLQKSLDKYRK